MNVMKCTCFAFQAEAGPHLLTKFELFTHTASKQSAHDHYVADIAVVSCLTSNRHALLGEWEYAASPQLQPGVPRPGVEHAIFELQAHDCHITVEFTTVLFFLDLRSV